MLKVLSVKSTAGMIDGEQGALSSKREGGALFFGESAAARIPKHPKSIGICIFLLTRMGIGSKILLRK